MPTTDSGERRQELSHSQVEGRGRGDRHAAHRHRPQPPQMIESDDVDDGDTGVVVLSGGESGLMPLPAHFFSVPPPGALLLMPRPPPDGG